MLCLPCAVSNPVVGSCPGQPRLSFINVSSSDGESLPCPVPGGAVKDLSLSLCPESENRQTEFLYPRKLLDWGGEVVPKPLEHHFEEARKPRAQATQVQACLRKQLSPLEGF